VRIVAGSAKGTRLAPVPAGTRPVSDRAREGLFSSLGAWIDATRVLDLFAGTGAMGIEALSRGAAGALFVDSAPGAVKVIQDNLRRTHLEGSGTVKRLDVWRALHLRPSQFDLVVADPPYALAGDRVDDLLANIAGQGLCAAGCKVVLTRQKGSYTPVIPLHWQPISRLAYGDALILVFQTP
jgi:16S rRNA (guanine966-N2)-methyltransferase